MTDIVISIEDRPTENIHVQSNPRITKNYMAVNGARLEQAFCGRTRYALNVLGKATSPLL
jgi:hypothetical protein